MPYKKLIILIFFIPGLVFGQYRLDSSPKSLTIVPLDEISFSSEEKSENLLKVYVGTKLPSPTSEIPPVLGKVVLQNNSLIFTPTFPFRPGQNYVAVVNGKHVLSFMIHREDSAPRPRLLNIYPSVDTIPANQLKLYVSFNTPMSEGRAYDYVKVKDKNGKIIQTPFVPLQPELWDENHTRLTLWFDPGRIKRGLESNKTFGEVLSPGQIILLEIDSEWQDQIGQPLGKKTLKWYCISENDRVRPVPEEWNLILPHINSQEPLNVYFGESMDWALLNRCISVWNEDNLEMKGNYTIHDGERIWSWQPEQPWSPGNYYLRIDSFLEDLAGNNLNRAFDRDLSKEQANEGEKNFFYLHFNLKK
ncbi:MAG: hypothetical protein KDE26_04500 [Bacteroidetes bacterium]|nr:hypothetical protein [Bacteroidota bacterium]